MILILVAMFSIYSVAIGTTEAVNLNKNITPGAHDISVTQENIHQTICVEGWSKKHRAVPGRLKRQVCKAYNVNGKCPDGNRFEIDHLISLELGGSNDIKNLWPQWYEPRPGAHEKDEVENWLHQEVCADRIPLGKAQEFIRNRWEYFYWRLHDEEARR